MSDRFEKHARTVTLLTFLSRLTGLARDAALSRVFGAGPLMSAFFFAFMIPNLFRRLFGEGALSAAFLPIYARLHETDAVRCRAFASLTVAWLAIGLGALTIVAEAALLLLASLNGHDHTALWLTAIMLPYMPLVCLVAVLGAMLQVRGRFGPTAASPVILNLCIMGAAVLLLPYFDSQLAVDARQHTFMIAASVIVAGVLQLVWTVIALREKPWWTREQASARDETRAMVRLAGPMILSLGVLQLNTFFDGLIASYPVTFQTRDFFGWHFPLDEGAMAVVSFAQRLYQFPLGVFGIAIATAIFPLLSKQALDPAAFVTTLRRGLRLVLFIGLPASAGLLLVQRPLTAVIYEGGEFSAEQTSRVAAVVAGYALAIWAYSMTHVLTRAFYARGDSRGPMRIALAVVALNLVLNCSLIWLLREAGLAWSTATCAVVQVAWLLRRLRRSIPGVVDRSVRTSWLQTITLTLLMSGIVGLVLRIMPVANSWSDHAVHLAILVAAGSAAITLGAIVFGMPELRWALGRRIREGE